MQFKQFSVISLFFIITVYAVETIAASVPYKYGNGIQRRRNKYGNEQAKITFKRKSNTPTSSPQKNALDPHNIKLLNSTTDNRLHVHMPLQENSNQQKNVIISNEIMSLTAPSTSPSFSIPKNENTLNTQNVSTSTTLMPVAPPVVSEGDQNNNLPAPSYYDVIDLFVQLGYNNQEINLAGYGMNATEFGHLIASLKGRMQPSILLRVQNVNFSGNKMNDLCAFTAAALIQQMPHLETLNVTNCGMTSKGTHHIFSALAKTSTLKTIYFNGNTLGENFGLLVAYMKQNPQVRLQANIDATTIPYVRHVLTQPQSTPQAGISNVTTNLS